MFLPKLREIREALSSLFSAPYTTRFPAQPDTASGFYRGMPRYKEEACVGCGTCAQVCPSSAIEITDDPVNRVRSLQVEFGSCIQCGQCQDHCITGEGIKNTNFYSLAVADKKAKEVFEIVEKELVLCEVCGRPIGCRDHLRWIRERLGAKAYAHPNLLLRNQEELASLAASKVKTRIRREDQIKYACGRCRQKIVVADEF
jgi:formate hydrogenlyase subunit 6/NADH:ubiquinone oxidoreductase subunit I